MKIGTLNDLNTNSKRHQSWSGTLLRLIAPNGVACLSKTSISTCPSITNLLLFWKCRQRDQSKFTFSSEENVWRVSPGIEANTLIYRTIGSIWTIVLDIHPQLQRKPLNSELCLIATRIVNFKIVLSLKILRSILTV